MQHAQFNFVVIGFVLLCASAPLKAGTIVKPHKPDPLLDGGEVAACATGADYAAGADVNGHAVPRADIAAVLVPVPDSIGVPLAQGGQAGPYSSGMGERAYASLDGRRLEPLLNPPPCHNGPSAVNR